MRLWGFMVICCCLSACMVKNEDDKRKFIPKDSSKVSTEQKGSVGILKTDSKAQYFFQELPCRSLRTELVHNTVLNTTSQIVFFHNNIPFDTLDIADREASLDMVYLIDINFDGYCDVIAPDALSASHGAMNYYYFRFYPDIESFVEDISLPAVHGGIQKIDSINKEVELYCRYQYRCNLKYKFVDSTFVNISGKLDFDNP